MFHFLPQRLENRVLLAATPVMVADLNTNGLSSYPAEFTVFDGNLYFSAFDNQHARSLWRFDGTQTTLAAGIASTQEYWPGLSPQELTVFDGALYFRGFTSASGYELWKYDGTSATIAADLRPNSSTDPQWNSSHPAGLKVIGDKLFFTADDGVSGREIWTFDGTTATRLADLNPGLSGSEPFPQTTNFVELGGAVYFVGQNGDNRNHLFRYDGQNIVRVDQAGGASQINEFSGNGELTAFNGALYFAGAPANNYIDRELWKFDGTSFSQVADIWPGPQGSYPQGLYVFKNALYFSAATGPEIAGLYKFDGVSATRAGDVGWNRSELGIQRDLTILNDDLYFTSTGGLWRFDGQSETRVAEAPVGTNKAAFGNAIYLSLDSQATGTEPARFDGDSVQMIADVRPGTDQSYPTDFSLFGEDLYLTAYSNLNSNSDIWKYDGSGAHIADPSRQYFEPETLVELNGKMYFTAANDGDVGWDLWRYDGDHSTKVLGDTTGFNIYPPGIISFGGVLLIRGYGTGFGGGGDDGAIGSSSELPSGDGLWAFDGTNLQLIAPSLWVPVNFGQPSSYAILDGALYFTAGHQFEQTPELWKFDGSTVSRVPGIAASLSLMDTMQTYDGAIYFGADDASGGGYELWKYDGAQATLAAEIRPGEDGSYPRAFAVHEGSLYFSATNGSQFGNELWRFDADSGQATQVTNTPLNGVANLASLAGVLYFTAATSPTDFYQRLWSYDGVEAKPIGDLIVNSRLFHFQNALYFGADDGLHGSELWKMEPDVPVGDLNRDGTVSIADFITLSSNFGKSNVGWSGGDVNYDNQVTIDDFIDLAANFGKSNVQPAAAAESQSIALGSDATTEQPVTVEHEALHSKKAKARAGHARKVRQHAHHRAKQRRPDITLLRF